MSLEIRCCFHDSGWAWRLHDRDTVEVYSRGHVDRAAVLTGAQLAQLVAQYLAQVHLVAELLPQVAPDRALPAQKPLARGLHGIGRRRLRGYGTTGEERRYGDHTDSR